MSGKSALLIIDVQNDFCEGGSLAVPKGNSVINPINDLIASRKWDLIVATQDWHPPNHVSFASNHQAKKPFDQYQIKSETTGDTKVTTLWPDHCVQNTLGAAIVDGLDLSKVNVFVKKGSNPECEFYSAFHDVFKQNETNLKHLLDDNNITNVTIVGLAFDFCVMETALSAAQYGFKVEINTKCTKAISDEGEIRARNELSQAGVKLL